MEVIESQLNWNDAVKVLHCKPANLEDFAVGTGLEKVNFHSNPKEGQYERMFNDGTIALILRWQSKAQNSPTEASTVHEMRTSRCSSWI